MAASSIGGLAVPSPTRASGSLVRLIAANAPYWAGEAEVVRTYFASATRTAQTDRTWVLHQAYKEYWDGYVPVLRVLAADETADPGRTSELVDVLRDELNHYEWFAGLYDELAPDGQPGLDPGRLQREGPWVENTALGALRAAHREQHGDIGRRAQWFTEGGYVTLYREGRLLAGRGGIDEHVASVCAKVYEDEFDHMLSGIAGLDQLGLSESDWQRLQTLTVAQLRLRIRMRNAQFSQPLSPGRIDALCEGAAEPAPFDWVRAGLA